MITRSFISCAAAVLLSVGLGAKAQQNPAEEPQKTTQVSTAGTIVHLEGCVFPKRAMSTMKPVIAPVGSEDYVLTHTKVVAGTGGAATESDGSAFKLEQVSQERLRALIGKRVGVTGRIGDEPELPEFQVISIREISGSCPSTPVPRS